MIKIEPIVFPIIGDAEYLDITIQSFPTNALTCNLYYRIYTAEGKMCLEGQYQLTEEQFADWGQDNSYIDNIIANHLNITIKP